MNQPTNLRELFEAALALAPTERAAYLAQHCFDTQLRAAAERLLDADEDFAPRLLDRPCDAVLERIGDAEPALSLPSAGTVIGPFTILDKLGEGGSSIVFRASREQEGVKQVVALKLLRRGVYSAEEQRQFRRERLALAQLQHPGVARLIEGGVAETGVPYIALELVDGKPITDYVRLAQLGLRDRLKVFVAVCRAVEAAHRALIVHRDLKPSNVLVTRDGEVKLLDFGIAKLLLAEGEDGTRTQHAALTPAYAAPEQFVQGLITTATDVYALGVLLSELITGNRRGPDDDRSPSSLISENTAPGVLPASPATTRRQLRGDLDNIVIKATEHDPDRRYASAGMFAEDIERHLAGQPVTAHPSTRWYRTRKFVARHKGGVLTTTALLLAVFAALGIALWQANIARQQAHVAREQAERADTIRQFLVGVFDQAEPDANLGKPITAGQLLEQGQTQLSAGADMQTGTRLDLTVLIAHLYWDLGDYAHAEPLLKQAAASASDPNVSDEIKARTLMMIAKTEAYKNKFDDALTHAKQALVIARRAGGAGDDSASEARRVVAESLRGKDNSKEAEPVIRDALANDRALYGDRHRAVIDDWTILGGVLTELSRFDEGKVALQNAVDLARLVYGPNHSSVAEALQELSGTLSYAGDYAKAEQVQREALAIFEKVYGPAHNETIIARHNLFWAIERQGRYQEALTGRLEMMKVLEQLPAAQPKALAPAYTSLGNDYFKLGRLDEAESALRKALAVWVKLHGSSDEWDSADPMGVLADVLSWQGRYAEAETTMRHAIAIEQQHEPADSGWLNRDHALLGDMLRRQHRHDEALRETSAAVEARRGAKADPIQCYLFSRLSLAQLDAGDAAAARTTATESIAMARSVFPPRHMGLSGPLYALARADLAQGLAAEAEPLLREVLALVSPPYPPGDLRVIEIQTALVDALESLGRNDEASKLRAEIEPALHASRSPYASELLAHLTNKTTNR